MIASNDWIPVEVAEVVQLTPLVKRFRLVALDGAALAAFSGGAHIVVEMADGDAIRRNAYSLMSDPSDFESYEITVRRDDTGRGGSCFMHRAVETGTMLRISRPVNLFPLVLGARKHLFIAGGIGITPFMAMMKQLHAERAPFEMHYAAQSRESAVYADELVERFGGRVALYFSDRGERMHVDEILSRQPVGSHLYVCGPERLIEHSLATAYAAGWPRQNVHQERFIAPAAGAPYEVRLARSGMTVKVKSSQSMLEAIEEAGVDAPHLCRGGACGQCETRVLTCDGALLHADHYLTDEEKEASGKVMLCVSRFAGRELVLDL